jgi:hypothetical protein
MTRFLIEREIHGAEDLTQDDLAKIAQTSNDAVAGTPPDHCSVISPVSRACPPWHSGRCPGTGYADCSPAPGWKRLGCTR